MSKINITLPLARRQCLPDFDKLPVCDLRTYLLQIEFVARQAASTTDPKVARLSLQLLAKQARTLEALARGCQ